MARGFLTDADFRSVQAAQKAIILAGTPHRSVYGMFTHDMQEDIRRVTQGDQRYKNTPTPPYTVRIGTTRLTKQTGSLSLIFDRTKLGDTTIASAGADVRIDLTKELQWLMVHLKLRSPVVTGNYRKSMRYVVAKSLSEILPRGSSWTVAGVTNVAVYASALENVRRLQTFRRVFTQVQSRAKAQGYDARMDYLAETAAPSNKGLRYPTPVIWIGQLNSMRGRTGIQFKKRRRRRR
jgi:hypothetical protein